MVEFFKNAVSVSGKGERVPVFDLLFSGEHGYFHGIFVVGNHGIFVVVKARATRRFEKGGGAVPGLIAF